MGTQVQTGFPNGIRSNAASTFLNRLEFAQGSDIASAGTVNLGAATGNTVNITGTTTITALGTATAGIGIRAIFAGVLVLTHNATSLILPSSSSITTAAGDAAFFVSLGAGNWKCLSYTRQTGAALVGAGGDASTNTATSVDNEVVLFSSTTGKLLKRANAFSGFAFLTAGVLTAIASTGSGSVVLATTPTLVTPVLGVATATSINRVAFTQPATGATLTIVDGKTATFSNTITIAGTDGSTLNVGAGGTLGSAAFTASSAYEVPLTFSTGLTRTTNTVTVNASQSISTLSNLTANGLVTTSGGTGALSVTVMGTGVLTFLTTPTSANLLAAVTDETGTGLVVFNTTPTLVTPILGVASATSLSLPQGQYASSTLTTAAVTANQVLLSVSASAFRTLIAFVQVTSGSSYQTIQVIVTHDGTTPSLTVMGDVFTGASLASFDADINTGNLRLQTTPINAVTVYRVLSMTINI